MRSAGRRPPQAPWKGSTRLSLHHDHRTTNRTSARRARLSTALVSATVLIVISPGEAQAHHGFDDFDTARPVFIAGTVSQVRWGEPHSYFTVTIDSDRPADTPERDLPEGLRDAADSDPIGGAPSCSGSNDELEVTIAPTSFTSMWGLDRELDARGRGPGT
jgi:hypothetical protein